MRGRLTRNHDTRKRNVVKFETSPTLDAADSNIRLRRRRGLIIYFASPYPAFCRVRDAGDQRQFRGGLVRSCGPQRPASVVARLALHDGFGDVSFVLGARTRLEGDWTGAKFFPVA